MRPEAQPNYPSSQSPPMILHVSSRRLGTPDRLACPMQAAGNLHGRWQPVFTAFLVKGQGRKPAGGGRNLALRGLRGILRSRSPSQSSAKVCPISEDSAETVDIIAYEDTLGCCERELQNHLSWFSRVSDMYVGCPIDSMDVHGHGADGSGIMGRHRSRIGQSPPSALCSKFLNLAEAPLRPRNAPNARRTLPRSGLQGGPGSWTQGFGSRVSRKSNKSRNQLRREAF